MNKQCCLKNCDKEGIHPVEIIALSKAGWLCEDCVTRVEELNIRIVVMPIITA